MLHLREKIQCAFKRKNELGGGHWCSTYLSAATRRPVGVCVCVCVCVCARARAPVRASPCVGVCLNSLAAERV